MQFYRSHVLVCAGTGCTSSGSAVLFDEFEQRLKDAGIENEVKVVKTGCFGLCAEGPIVVVYPEGAMYCRVTKADVQEIVTEHLVKGRIVKRLLEPTEKTVEETDVQESEFFKKQMRVALRNCGRINPENIDEYIAYDGYAALGKVVTEMTPEEVIDTVLKSGLRGRGGAGFRPGRKMGFCAQERFRPRNTSAAMRMRVIRARLWIEACLRAIRTSCWRRWPSPDMRLVRIRVTFTSERNIRSRYRAFRLRLNRPKRMACWAKTFSAPIFLLILRSVWAPARSYAAKKRR